MNTKHKAKKVIHENIREVDIFEDFWTISKECRKSCYYLESVKNLTNGHILPYSKREQFLKKCKDIDALLLEYKEIDNKISIHEAFIGDNPEKYNHKDIDFDILTMVKQFIVLKIKMDLLQCELLSDMILDKRYICEELVNKNLELKSYYLELESEYLMDSVFTKSTDEDKIVTYKLNSKDIHIIKEYSEQITLPDIFKIRDYSYKILNLRKQYRHSQKTLIKLLVLVQQINEKNYLKLLNQKQEKYSKQVTFLTWIILFLTFFTLIIGIVSLFDI